MPHFYMNPSPRSALTWTPAGCAPSKSAPAPPSPGPRRELALATQALELPPCPTNDDFKPTNDIPPITT